MRTFAATRLGLIIVGMAAFASACTAGPTIAAQGRPSSTPTPAVSSRTPTLTPVSGCLVTLPAPVPSSEPWRASLFGSDHAYGNGQLWVGGLSADGTIPFKDADESTGWKLGWWRAGPGDLSITGRRLDAAAPPLRTHVPSGYGASGFQSSGVYFPTPGCWEITGVAGPARLSFVILIVG